MEPAPGTGPFVFKSFCFKRNSEVTRFDKYFEYDEKTGDRLPYLDGVHCRKIVDETVRWTRSPGRGSGLQCEACRQVWLVNEKKKPDTGYRYAISLSGWQHVPVV